ncbi:MAG: GAF domain-containing protein [Pirellulales bacterium]|nr:GAF domain-containing protein [Pirellulales bacterium]
MPDQHSPPLAVYEEPPATSPPALAEGAYDSICEAFSLATGVPLFFSPGLHGDAQSAWHSGFDRERLKGKNRIARAGPTLWSQPVRSSAQQVVGHLKLVENSDSVDDPRHASAVLDLAQTLGRLINDVADARRTAETLASEIALTSPFTARKQTRGNLNQWLQSVLQALVDSLECVAAAMYVLDDATSELRIRSMWGLPVESLSAQPRILETAKADLEAMLGHAVAISNGHMFDLWSVPEREYDSAVCVPLATATTILGTVWIFDDKPRTFEDRELNLIEVLAGRLAVEIEHAALVGEVGSELNGTPRH